MACFCQAIEMQYANPELQNATTQLAFVSQFVQSLQTSGITVLLDLHTLDKSAKDPFWYLDSAPARIEDTLTYQALDRLSSRLCGDMYWNII